MPSLIQRLMDDGAAHLRTRVVAMFIMLALANAAAWAWALIAFRDHPVLLGTSLLAYTFGLRHAVDADHIAAIDNVTRKLMQGGKRPVGVGLFFSLGHSSIVILATVAIALFASTFRQQLDSVHAIGGVVGTLVSSAFLLAIAAMNLLILVSIHRTFRRVRAGGVYCEEDMNLLLARGGFLARVFRPLFAAIRSSWHMYPLGFLFGLGFDTATEVGLLGISAAEATKGLSIWSILVFPALFTAGMALIDSADSVLMLGAYGWAFVKPLRKLYYNITITSVSILVALLVGGIEALGLIGDQFAMKGTFWDFVGSLNDNFGDVGFVIVGVFIASWIVSAVIYRVAGYDRVAVRVRS